MENYLKELDENLVFIKSFTKGDTLKIYTELTNVDNKLIHSRKVRVIKDIPYNNYKVELHIISKKYFNEDPDIDKLTVSEKLSFVNSTGRRTLRLDNLILELCAEISAIGCERIVRKNIANISDSSILRLIKKNE